MKRLWLSGLYEAGLLAVMFLIALHAPIAVGIGQLFPAQAELAKAWKEIALTVLSLVAMILLTRHGLWAKLLRSWPVRLGLAFITIHLLMAAVFGGDPTSIIVGLTTDLRFVVMFGLMYVLVLLRPDALRRGVYAVLAGAAVVVGFGLLQIAVLPDDILRGLGYSRDTITPFTTIDRNPDFVRINSTTRGPNPLGALMVIYVALAGAYVARRYSRLEMRKMIIAFLAVLAGIAVLYASHSRSAFVAMAAAVAVLLTGILRPTKRVIASALGGLVLLGLCLVILAPTDWFSNVVLHEDPESTVMTKSNDAHIESLFEGAARMVVQPLGAGIGSTGSASLYDDDSSNNFIVENIYFFIAHETGWLGLIVFALLNGTVFAGLWRRRSSWLAFGLFASGIGLAGIGLLLPVWVDETVAMTWWGLAGAVLGSGIIKTHEQRTSK